MASRWVSQKARAVYTRLFKRHGRPKPEAEPAKPAPQIPSKNPTPALEGYLSCPWIEAGLVFQHGYLTVCCTNHSDGKKGSPFICAFDGGEFPLDRIFMVKEELRQKLWNGDDCACTGCPGLLTKKWPENNKIFRRLAIANFVHCNLDCYYCENHSLPEKTEGLVRSAYDILPILTMLDEKGLISSSTGVEWGGGEPTLVHEFEPLLRFMLERGMPTDIHTNATTVSPAILDGLKSGAIKSVTCSVDAGTPETYLIIKKRDLFDRVWRNLAVYVEANRSAVKAKYIILKENASVEEASAFVAKCLSTGISRIQISRDTQRPICEKAAGIAATITHLAVKEGMEVEIFPTIFGSAEMVRIMYCVHQLILQNNTPVDFSKLFRLSHRAFEYLRFNSASTV